ncbi:MAG: hypothetical protein GXP38_15520 [Chloroflexi bacterium]|nr:hypothetical protein [Chloroflexota bacterium]
MRAPDINRPNILALGLLILVFVSPNALAETKGIDLVAAGQTYNLWQSFQERCLTPAENGRDFRTDGLVEISPTEVFPENLTGSPAPSNEQAFSPNSGSWTLYIVGKELCYVLSQSEEQSARQAAESWAEAAVASERYDLDHHLGNELHGLLWYGGQITVSHGDIAIGWKTGFGVFVK